MVEEYGVYKGDIVDAVVERTGGSRGEVSEVMNAIIEEVMLQLESGQKVCITGFGTLDTPYRKERLLSHPEGYTMVVPRKRRVRFKPSKCLKERVGRERLHSES